MKSEVYEESSPPIVMVRDSCTPFALAAILLLVGVACASDESEGHREVQGAHEEADAAEDPEATAAGPEACHALDSPERCSAFEGVIEFRQEGMEHPVVWPGCGWFSFLAAGPTSTCLEPGHGICVPVVQAGLEVEVGWVRLGDGESIAHLTSLLFTVFPPGYGGATYSLPLPPDFEYQPLTESQRTLMEMEIPPLCP